MPCSWFLPVTLMVKGLTLSIVLAVDKVFPEFSVELGHKPWITEKRKVEK